jgi:hypothetical protein
VSDSQDCDPVFASNSEQLVREALEREATDFVIVETGNQSPGAK